MTRTVLFTVCISFLAADFAGAAELRAGRAWVDLTPPLEMKAPLGGYGERMNRPAEGVHDRILAKAVVLFDGKKKFALVTADMLGFPPPFKPAVVARLASRGWTSDQIMLLPSHSHTSIEMAAINPQNTLRIPQIGIYQPELHQLTVDHVVRVIEQAEKELAPITVGTSSRSIAGWNRNRRRRDGPTDPELTVTRIDAGGKPFAVLVQFTAHPTFMDAQDMLFSGGWPGHLQRTAEAIIGEGVQVMYYNGAEGDQSPVARGESGPSRWERAERYGRELALVVVELWRETPTERDVAFAFHRQAIDLPERTWHPDFMKTGGAEYGLSEELMQQLLPLMCPSQTASVSVRVGELAIVGVPGEMAAELGMRIKTETAEVTGAKHPVIGGLADEWISYILPGDEYRRGGYESSVSFYGAGLGERIVTGVLEGIESSNLK